MSAWRRLRDSIRWGDKARPIHVAAALHGRIVEQARDAAFYRELAVPDSLDGRFEMIVLHAHLLLRRLRREGSRDSADLAQALFDRTFADLDEGLREMGVGDLGVARRIKSMATGFYGRMAAYDAGFAADPVALRAALRRNAFGTVPDVPAEAVAALEEYMRQADRSLSSQPYARLMEGRVDFPAVDDQGTRTLGTY